MIARLSRKPQLFALRKINNNVINNINKLSLFTNSNVYNKNNIINNSYLIIKQQYRFCTTTTTTTIKSPFNFKENKTINKQELNQLINSGFKDYYLIDVRNPMEVEQTALIPTAIHIPLGMLPAVVSMSDSEFEEIFDRKKFGVNDNLIFYCLKGLRSEMAANTARDLGYRTVLSYPGSYNDWISN